MPERFYLFTVKWSNTLFKYDYLNEKLEYVKNANWNIWSSKNIQVHLDLYAFNINEKECLFVELYEKIARATNDKPCYKQKIAVRAGDYRNEFSLVCVKGRTIYLTGGRCKIITETEEKKEQVTLEATSSVLTLDLDTKILSEIAAMNEPRYDHTSTVIEENVYVVAGWNDSMTCDKSIEVFSQGRWTVSNLEGFPPRKLATVCAINQETILILGGHRDMKDGGPMMDVLSFNTDEWTVKRTGYIIWKCESRD